MKYLNKWNAAIELFLIYFYFTADESIQNFLIMDLIFIESYRTAFGWPVWNYVMQSALESLAPSVLHKLVLAIQPYISTMRSTSGGRRIVSKVTKQLALNHIKPTAQAQFSVSNISDSISSAENNSLELNWYLLSMGGVIPFCFLFSK